MPGSTVLGGGRGESAIPFKEQLPDETFIDGEVVAFDESGRPSFNVLQNSVTGKADLIYYVYDVRLGASILFRQIQRSSAVSAGLHQPHHRRYSRDPVQFGGRVRHEQCARARAQGRNLIRLQIEHEHLAARVHA